MGIMAAWFVPSSPGYVRAKGATPHARVAGARLQRSARRPTARTARRSAFPRSCNPPALRLQPADGRHAGRQRRAAPTSEGSVKVDALVGNAGDAGRRSRRAYHGLDDRRAPQHHRPARLHGPAAADTVASASPTATTAPRCSHRSGHQLQGHRAVRRPPRTRRWARRARSPRPPTRSRARAPSRRAGARSGSSARCALNDGGADGVASTTPNTLFAVQGVLIP